MANRQLLATHKIRHSSEGWNPVRSCFQKLGWGWVPASAGTTKFLEDPNSVERLFTRTSGVNASERRASAGVLRRGHEGFSLLEILVAFTLLAVAMGVLMQIFSSGVNGATLADRYAKATMYAESKLASVGVEAELKESTTAGKFDDDFSWSLVVRPYLDPMPKEQSVIDYEKLMATQLYEIALNVSFTPDDRRERMVSLSTLKLGPKT